VAIPAEFEFRAEFRRNGNHNLAGTTAKILFPRNSRNHLDSGGFHLEYVGDCKELHVATMTIDDTHGDKLTGTVPDYGSDCTQGFPPCNPDCGPGCSVDCEHAPLLPNYETYHTCLNGGFGSRILFYFEGYVIIKLHCWLPLRSPNDAKVSDILVPGDSIEKPRMRYFCGNPIVCHRREADCSDADGRHLSRAFRF